MEPCRTKICHRPDQRLHGSGRIGAQSRIADLIHRVRRVQKLQ